MIMLKEERVNMQTRVGFELPECVKGCLTYSTELLVDFVRKEAPTLVRLFQFILAFSRLILCRTEQQDKKLSREKVVGRVLENQR